MKAGDRPIGRYRIQWLLGDDSCDMHRYLVGGDASRSIREYGSVNVIRPGVTVGRLIVISSGGRTWNINPIPPIDSLLPLHGRRWRTGCQRSKSRNRSSIYDSAHRLCDHHRQGIHIRQQHTGFKGFCELANASPLTSLAAMPRALHSHAEPTIQFGDDLVPASRQPLNSHDQTVP